MNLGSFRLGAGPSLHLGPGVSGSGFAAGEDTSFDTAVGALGTLEYLLPMRSGGKLGLGVRGTWLKLSTSAGSNDGSGIGFVFGLRRG